MGDAAPLKGDKMHQTMASASTSLASHNQDLSCREEKQERLAAEFSRYLEFRLRKSVGPSFRCIPTAVRKSLYDRERRASSTGLAQLLIVDGAGSGRLMISRSLFFEMIGGLTGQALCPASVVKAALSPVEKNILQRLGKIVAKSLELAVPKAFAVFDEHGYAPHPEVTFALMEESPGYDAALGADMWVIEVEIRSELTVGSLVLLLPPMDVALADVATEKYSSQRELWENHQTLRSVERSGHLAFGLSRLMRTLEFDGLMPLLRLETDTVIAAFLSYAPPQLAVNILKHFPAAQARNIVGIMLMGPPPKRELIDALYMALRKHIKCMRQKQQARRRLREVPEYLRPFLI